MNYTEFKEEVDHDAVANYHLMEKLILNKGDKRILKKYLKYYAEKLEITDYSLSTDFIGCTPEEDMKKYHIGMQFIIEQMQHELNGIKTVGELQ